MTRKYIDKNSLAYQMGMDISELEGFMEELVSTYVTTLEESVTNLTQFNIALQDDIHLEVHKLKGVTGSVGDTTLSDFCILLDRRHKDGEMITEEEIATLIDMLKESITHLKQ